MKILVPVKRVADPDNANKVKVTGDATALSTEGLEWKPNPFDEYAVEAALRLNENAPKNEKLGRVVDAIKERFGDGAVLRASVKPREAMLREARPVDARPTGRGLAASNESDVETNRVTTSGVKPRER